jgi:thiol-disulfide isomerase/thioredoxin
MIRALTVGLVLAAQAAAHASPLAGLALVDRSGAPYSARSSPPPPVTLVGIWATWCPSCRDELPALIAFGRELEREGGRLLLVSVDRTPEKGVRHLAAIGYQGEAAYDPGGKSVGGRLGITGIPTVVVLDRAGRERDRIVGSAPAARARIRASALAVIHSEKSHEEPQTK